MPVDCYGGKEGFKLTQERDLIKERQCRENGLRPIYYCLSKYIDNFLGEKVIRNEEELLEKINEYGKEN